MTVDILDNGKFYHRGRRVPQRRGVSFSDSLRCSAFSAVKKEEENS